MAASGVIRARMKAIIAAADAVLTYIPRMNLGAREGCYIQEVAKVRADAISRLEG